MTTYSPRALTARWNKDLSITLYCGGRKVYKTRGPALKADVNPFLEGWFGGKAHSVRWVYA